MNYKIYRKGSILKIEDIDKPELFNGLAKNIFIDKNNVFRKNYRVFNMQDFSFKNILQIGKLYKEDGTLYTEAEFDIFIETNTGTDAQLAETISSGSLVEFDTTLIIPALTDEDFNITPTGTEIRDYQIFETSNPSQDITSSVSSLGALPNQIRIFSALAITIKIIGTRK